MTQSQALSPRTWLPGLLLVISISTTGWTQDKTSINYDALVHETISKLDEFKNSGSETYTKWLPELQRLQFKIKQYETLANIELEHAKELQKASLEYVKAVTAELEQLDAEAIKSQGMRIQSAETIEFLLRNCLIEQQRLQLDSIAAKKMLEKKSKPNNREFEAARLRLEAEEISLKGMMVKMEATKKEIEALKSGDRKDIDKLLLEQEQDIAIRSTKLRAMMAEFEQAKASQATTYEEKFTEIQLRQEMLSAQMDRLAKQQEWAKTAKQINAQIELASKRMREAEDSVLKSVEKIREMEALNQIIKNVVDPKKKKE